MGDNRRFSVVANFIARNVKPCKVADVAGGMGVLSYHLIQHGFNSVVIDPRHTNLPKEYRSQIRHQHFNIPRLRTCFYPALAKDFDFIVGLHPDEATETICKSIVANHKTGFIVPCCDFWKKDFMGSPHDILSKVCAFFKHHGRAVQEIHLPMSGKNVGILVR